MVIAGYMRHMCCDTTARQAVHRGFQVEFLSDATGTLALNNAAGQVTAEELQRAILCAQQMLLSEVISTDAWCRRIAHESSVEELVRLLKNPQGNAALRRVGGMDRFAVAPDVIARRTGSVIIHQTAFQDECLFDAAMTVSGKRCSRSQAEQRGKCLAVNIAPQDLQLDTWKAGWLPGEFCHRNVVRSEFKAGHGCRRRGQGASTA